MEAVLLEQTTTLLTSHLRRWDRRLRLAQSILWGPRGAMIGLMIGLVVASVARTRPWILPGQVALITVCATVVTTIGVLAWVWLWPQSTERLARYFDRRFGLKERVSTALEVSSGVIPLPDRLIEYQMKDAARAAEKVNPVVSLPIRVQRREVIALIALILMAAYMVMAPNPKADELRERRSMQRRINQQVQQLNQTMAQVQANPNLTPEEQEQLRDALQQAQQTLQQSDVTPQENAAALSEAEEALSELSDGMTPQDEAAYQQAASSLANSDRTGELAEALNQADLGQAADAMESMSDDLGRNPPSDAERQQMADQLDQAADALEEQNPALAEKLRESADALRQGDMDAAQQAMDEAANALREQQQQLQNSPLSQAAQQAQSQVQEMRDSSSQQPQGQQGQQQQQNASANSQSQTGEGQQGQQQGQQGDSSAQSGETGDVQSEGSQQAQAQSDQAGNQGGEQQSAQSSSSSQAPGDEEGQSAGSGGQETSEQPGSQQVGSNTEGSSSALSAGEGEGGAGQDVTSGVPNAASQGEISTNNSPSDDGGLQEYNPQHESFTVGGEGESVQVQGQNTSPDSTPLQEGEFSNNPTGQSQRTYSQVSGDYADVTNHALDDGRIPLDQRGVIHDYLSSLTE